jgi:hypothetical protein
LVFDLDYFVTVDEDVVELWVKLGQTSVVIIETFGEWMYFSEVPGLCDSVARIVVLPTNVVFLRFILLEDEVECNSINIYFRKDVGAFDVGSRLFT